MSAALIGRTIGRCRIDRLLGVGGMGTVYGGVHESLKIPVAVKVLSPPAVPAQQTTSDWATRFLREAQLAATLRHPNIVRIYDVNRERGAYYIIMELLLGATLTEHIRRGPMPEGQARQIAHQVAAALSHAHARGIVHRDIKPDNVIVAADGTAVLTDFGIAAAERGERLTKEGMAVGTPWYVAPEQAQGGQLDARADIYSLGVMLYEMLTAQLPFEGNDWMNQVLARLQEEPIPITARRQDLSPDLVAGVSRMLSRRPADRIQSAEEVAQLLGAAAAERTLAPPEPLAASGPQPAVNQRTSELMAIAEGAGLPLSPPPRAHLVELKLADVRATLRLAEEESAGGASLLLVHRTDQADVIAFLDGRSLLAFRVCRGVPQALALDAVVAGAMARGEGALVVRKIDPAMAATWRTWLEGQRELGPLPVEIIRPLGLLARLRRERSSGVLAVTDGGQTTLVSFADGNMDALLAPPRHRQELHRETEGGVAAWLESCSPEAAVVFHRRPGSLVPAGSSTTQPDETLRAALQAAVAAATTLAGHSSRAFGLGSDQVFRKCLRQSTHAVRDMVPVAALSREAAIVDADAIWSTLMEGARTGRELVVKLVAEAILGGAIEAAAETLPPKQMAKARRAALDVLLQARPALEALGITPEAAEAMLDPSTPRAGSGDGR